MANMPDPATPGKLRPGIAVESGNTILMDRPDRPVGTDRHVGDIVEQPISGGVNGPRRPVEPGGAGARGIVNAHRTYPHGSIGSSSHGAAQRGGKTVDARVVGPVGTIEREDSLQSVGSRPHGSIRSHIKKRRPRHGDSLIERQRHLERLPLRTVETSQITLPKRGPDRPVRADRHRSFGRRESGPGAVEPGHPSRSPRPHGPVQSDDNKGDIVSGQPILGRIHRWGSARDIPTDQAAVRRSPQAPVGSHGNRPNVVGSRARRQRRCRGRSGIIDKICLAAVRHHHNADSPQDQQTG